MDFEIRWNISLIHTTVNVPNKGKGHPRKNKGEVAIYLEPIHNPALEGGGLSAPSSGCFTLGKDPVAIVQEAG